MVNTACIAGHLCRDPELRRTTKGVPVTSFTVAINRYWTTESGERKEEAVYVDCSAWNRTAESIAAHFRKGHPIFVSGELRMNQWEAEGQKRSKLYLLVDRFSFLRPKDPQQVEEAA
jgi:single-strand DNA-binding protein